MKISFADKHLEKWANDDRLMVRALGKIRAEKFRLRLSQLRFASHMEELRNLPGNFHELTHNRKGQWACDLDQPYRLIFTAGEHPIPVHKTGHYSWVEITSISVLEIINYHKEK